MRNQNKLILLLLSLCILGSTTACTGGSSGKSYEESDSVSAEAGFNGFSGDYGLSSSDSYAKSDSYNTGDTDSSADTSSPADTSDAADAVNQPAQMIARRASIDIDVPDAEAFTDYIEARVAALNGYITESRVEELYDGGPDVKEGHYIVKIPQDKLDGFLNDVGNAGRITSEYITAEDVMLQYTDIQSRLRMLNAEALQLESMMKQTKDMDQLIKLEDKLTNIYYQVDSFTKQKLVLENRVSYSEVEIDASEEANIEHPILEQLNIGVKKELLAALGNYAELALHLFTMIPTIILYICFFIFIIWFIRFIWIRVFKRKKKKTAVPAVSQNADNNITVQNQKRAAVNNTAATDTAKTTEPDKK